MRAISIELVKPAHVEHCSPRAEQSFADALKATLAEHGQPTVAGDNAPPDPSDFEAALALLGTLTPPMCGPPVVPNAIKPTPALSPAGADMPTPAETDPMAPVGSGPGTVPGEQRILPTPGAFIPPAPSLPPPIAGDVVAPLPPAQPSPVGDARVPMPSIPVPPSIVAPVAPEMAPTTMTPAVVEPAPTDLAAPVGVSSSTDLARATASNAPTNPAPLTEAPPPPIDAAARPAPSNPPEARGESSTDHRDGQPSLAAEALAATGSAAGAGAPAEPVARAARSVAELPSVVSDLARQSRTDSSPRRVVIPLDPPALGRVTVEIIVRADSVRVSLQHGDEAAFSALNAQRPAIEAALESNGLHLSGFDVSGNQGQRNAQTRTALRQFEALVEQIEPDGALRL